VLTNLKVEGPIASHKTDPDDPRYYDTWFTGGIAPRLGIANSPWEFRFGGWAIEGLSAHNKKTGESVHFAYETPFGDWYVRNAVHLPSDIVLFQLGQDQICAFDPATRRVALLWHGRGAVAVIEKKDP
jgi:hypothetical protein